jgi:hypothetical protein
MIFNKESYFRQKLNTVFNQLQFYYKSIKHVFLTQIIFLFIKLTIKEFLNTGSNIATTAHFYFKRLQVTFFIYSTLTQTDTIYSADKYKFYLYSNFFENVTFLRNLVNFCEFLSKRIMNRNAAA